MPLYTALFLESTWVRTVTHAIVNNVALVRRQEAKRHKIYIKENRVGERKDTLGRGQGRYLY